MTELDDLRRHMSKLGSVTKELVGLQGLFRPPHPPHQPPSEAAPDSEERVDEAGNESPKHSVFEAVAESRRSAQRPEPPLVTPLFPHACSNQLFCYSR